MKNGFGEKTLYFRNQELHKQKLVGWTRAEQEVQPSYSMAQMMTNATKDLYYTDKGRSVCWCIME